jgi:hypothetical protein
LTPEGLVACSRAHQHISLGTTAKCLRHYERRQLVNERQIGLQRKCTIEANFQGESVGDKREC